MDDSVSAKPAQNVPVTSRLWIPGKIAAAAAGIAVTAFALAVAELLALLGERAGVLNQFSSPLLAVGAAFITLTPEWLKQFAISTFGTQDKVALQVGMGITVLLLAAVIGLIGRRSPRAAAGALLAFVGLSVVAILTRPAAVGPLDVLPAVVGAAVGVGVLGLIFRRTATYRAELDGYAPDSVASPALQRRGFLQIVAATAGAATVAGALGRFLPSAADVESSRAALSVPSATAQAFPDGLSLAAIDEAVPGQPPFITPNADFYRIDTALSLPSLTAEDWSLKIHGLVGKERVINYSELVGLDQAERVITLTCVSNEVGGSLVGTAVWTGTMLGPIMTELGLDPSADCVLCTSSDGFTLTTPLESLIDGRDAMLAVAMNGEILPREHGFPVRMVVPGLYGYVSATKWVVDMKVTRFADEVAYWTQRGWSERGPIKIASRIDVPRGFSKVGDGDEVVFAGVAWAQDRGISAVEVQVDGGDWVPAELSPSLSKDTWRQWRMPWIASSGVHTVRCRAFDGNGELQDEVERWPIPNGATGYDARSITVG